MVKDRIKGGFLGVAIGDALGVPVEFKPRHALQVDPVKGYREFGMHNQPKGTWSDDTSLTLCLAESLKNGINYSDIAEKFISWLYEARWTATGSVFDVGITTREAIGILKKGGQPELAGPIDEYSNGNGSLMRILPIAFYDRDFHLDDRRRLAFDISAITHGHPRAKISCWFYSEVIRNLLLGLPKVESIDKAWDAIDNWQSANGGNSQWGYFKRCKSEVSSLNSSDIKSTGYVIDSLEASIYCFLTTDSFEASVLKAVNLGNDTDTTAAITGGLAGVFYGDDGIPEPLKRDLRKREEITMLIDEFTEGLPYGA